MNRNPEILLKVCGMRDEDNIREVAALNPAYMGFIFYPESRRYVGSNFNIPTDFPSHIKRVGVFVNEDTAEIVRLSTLHHLQFTQLHGEESVIQCIELKNNGLKVIKVFSVDPGFDFQNLNAYRDAVDYFLFDTKGSYRGGNGQSFDWKILESYDLEIPFFLSGGISKENVGEVKFLNRKNLHALDVNSKVESLPGIKDIEMIKALKTEMLNV